MNSDRGMLYRRVWKGRLRHRSLDPSAALKLATRIPRSALVWPAIGLAGHWSGRPLVSDFGLYGPRLSDKCET